MSGSMPRQRFVTGCAKPAVPVDAAETLRGQLAAILVRIVSLPDGPVKTGFALGVGTAVSLVAALRLEPESHKRWDAAREQIGLLLTTVEGEECRARGVCRCTFDDGTSRPLQKAPCFRCGMCLR